MNDGLPLVLTACTPVYAVFVAYIAIEVIINKIKQRKIEKENAERETFPTDQ